VPGLQSARDAEAGLPATVERHQRDGFADAGTAKPVCPSPVNAAPT
jgi:hypothetical protein